MKSFQKFCFQSILSFVIKVAWLLYFDKPIFDRFTFDFNGFFFIMEFILAGFTYVYIYEKTQFYKNIDNKKPTVYFIVFISCLVMPFIMSLVVGTMQMHLKIQIDDYLFEFVSNTFYNFVFLSIISFLDKLNGEVPIFRLNNRPFFYLKIFRFEILYACGWLFLVFVLATSDSRKNLEINYLCFFIDCIIFTIELLILAFFISYAVNRVAFFRKSFIFAVLITPFLAFWIIKLIGYPQDYFRVLISEGQLKIVTLLICNSIVSSVVKESKRNFKINKVTSDFSKKKTEYLQLKQQVNPHFLFNNLNTLISFIEINPKKAIEFGHHLSNTYRHYLKNQKDDFVSLHEELEFIKEYLEIYKAKFETGISFEITVQPAENRYILSLALQEVVDNIFKHNTIDENNPLKISIYSQENELCIENSISKKAVDESSKTGLENINKRYEILANKQIQIISQNDTYQVLLPIFELES